MSVEIVRRCLNRWLKNGERKKIWVRIVFECFLMDDALTAASWEEWIAGKWWREAWYK
jgi:hypothetical protein